MKWHLVKKELPEEKRLVIIYVPNRPWGWNGKGDIHYQIAWLEKGISQKEREALPDNSKRKWTYTHGDEGFNNSVPFCWETFGPDRFFGQEAKAWAYFEEYREELE